jgi:hypothetical protein
METVPETEQCPNTTASSGSIVRHLPIGMQRAKRLTVGSGTKLWGTRIPVLGTFPSGSGANLIPPVLSSITHPHLSDHKSAPPPWDPVPPGHKILPLTARQGSLCQRGCSILPLVTLIASVSLRKEAPRDSVQALLALAPVSTFYLSEPAAPYQHSMSAAQHGNHSLAREKWMSRFNKINMLKL